MNKITSVSTVCVCCLEEAVLETREECAKLKKIEKEELLMINLQSRQLRDV